MADPNRSREWEQIHGKTASQTGGWYVELEYMGPWGGGYNEAESSVKVG